MNKLQLIEAIQSLSRTNSPYAVLATVEEINETELTCNVAPILGTPDVYNVRLMPKDISGVAKKGFLQVPKKGSIVVVSFINGKDDAYVALFSEVDFIYLNGKNYGGLVQIEPLVEKVNKIEDLLNNLVKKYNAHTHTVPTLVTACGAGAGSTTPAPTAVTSSTESTVLQKTKKADLENTTVLHGNAE